MSQIELHPDTIAYRSKSDIDSALACLDILKGKTISNIKDITTIIVSTAQYNAKL